jgi:hypothetical protein
MRADSGLVGSSVPIHTIQIAIPNGIVLVGSRRSGRAITLHNTDSARETRSALTDTCCLCSTAAEYHPTAVSGGATDTEDNIQQVI